MTTIAYKNGIMAGDRNINTDDMLLETADKIFRIKSPLTPNHAQIIGLAGDMADIALCVEWMNSNQAPELKGALQLPPALQSSDRGGFVAIVITGRGILYTTASDVFNKTKAPFYAIGTGRRLALGAMAAGATAEEAVRIASQFDVYTGSEVDTLQALPHNTNNEA